MPPIDTPDTAQEVTDRIITDVEQSIAPFTGGKAIPPASWLRTLMVAFGNRVFDFYFSLDQAVREAFAHTAEDNLEELAADYGINRITGAPATGRAAIGGTAGSTIPEARVFTSGDGRVYRTTAPATITAQVIAVASITRVGTTATLTTSVPHNLAGNIPITVTGANEPEYNVSNAVATITGASTLTYTVTGSPATPATGTINLNATFVSLQLESEETGSDQNLASASVLQIQSPIVGVDDTAVVDFGELGGGSDQETLDALRDRLLDKIQNPVANYNVAQIETVARSVAGVTRVFVQEITPAVGQVTVYFMRDDDPTGPIPSGSEIAAVVAALEEIRPANTDPSDVFVLAPTPVSQDFTFSAVSPDTATMKAAIEANLAAFFAERTEVGEDVVEDAYRSAIFSTVDPVTGAMVASFTLSTPSGTITVNPGEIAILGTVTFT